LSEAHCFLFARNHSGIFKVSISINEEINHSGIFKVSISINEEILLGVILE